LIELFNDLASSDKYDLDGGMDAFVDLVGEVSDVSSFKGRGVLTRNKGVVVTMENGSEFQVTIVKSYSGKIGPDDEADEDDEE
jgi:hypothetical protein